MFKLFNSIINVFNVVSSEKEGNSALNFLRSKKFGYLTLSFIFYLSVLLICREDLGSFSTYRDALIYNFFTGYYYFFFCLMGLFGFTYYSITFIHYKIDYLSKFFIIIMSATAAYLAFYFIFMYDANILNNQLPEITALLCEQENVSNAYNYSSFSDNNKAVKIFTVLLVYLVIMFYFLRNIISTISELLIDYMDPERDIVMKLFKIFFYTLIFIFFPYIISDVVVFFY